MSIPLFFEAIEQKEDYSTDVFCDGGVMWNYPIDIFDSISFKEENTAGVNYETLGVRFLNRIKYYDISNLLNFVKNLYLSQLRVQKDIFNNNPQDILRSIQVDTGDVSAIDFNISPGDETYNFLYNQGYKAAKKYFENKMYL